MTKLTDLPGASEALDIPWAINNTVHLEVDVEAMTRQIGQVYCLPEHSKKEVDSKLLLDIVDKLSKNPDKWARLVRK